MESRIIRHRKRLFDPWLFALSLAHLAVAVICGIVIADGWSKRKVVALSALCIVSALPIALTDPHPRADFSCLGVDFVLAVLAWKVRTAFRPGRASVQSWPWKLLGWTIPIVWSPWVILGLLFAKSHKDIQLVSTFHVDSMALPVYISAQALAILGFAGGPSYRLTRCALWAYANLQSSQIVGRIVMAAILSPGPAHDLAIGLLRSELLDSLPLVCLIVISIFGLRKQE